MKIFVYVKIRSDKISLITFKVMEYIYKGKIIILNTQNFPFIAWLGRMHTELDY